MNTSVKQIATFMDSVKPAGTVMALAEMHRWIDDRPPAPFSVLNMLARHTKPDTVKVPFLFYNTYLMPGMEIEIPGATVKSIGESPHLNTRANEIGMKLQNESQNSGMIAALCEVWNEDDAGRILQPWQQDSRLSSVQGFGDGGWDDLQQTGSGLLNISVDYTIKFAQRYVFEERGSITEDADYFSNKGVLLTEIDVGFDDSRLEVYSTHLFNGGFEKTPPDSERIDTQLKQVDELVTFVQKTHQPQNVALIAGDFNIPAASDGYNWLMQRMLKINMTDVWIGRNDTKGFTSSFLGKNSEGRLKARKFICVPEQSMKEYCDDEESDKSKFHTDRIDYIFIQKPQPEHGINVDFTRPRRRPFLREESAEGFDEIESMSDHLGLETTLVISSK